MRFLLRFVLFLTFISPAFAQTYELSTPGRYTIFASPFGDPDALCLPQCDFSFGGTVTIETTGLTEDANGRPLPSELFVFTDSNLRFLTGLTGNALSNLVGKGVFLTEPYVGPPDPLPSIANVQQVTFEGDIMRVFIHNSQVGVDGGGELFNFTATLVPEPSAQFSMILAVVLLLGASRKMRARR